MCVESGCPARVSGGVGQRRRFDPAWSVDNPSPSPGTRLRDSLSGMTRPARELESKALKLSRRERARLAQRLISSLDQERDADADRLWLAEAERRLAELKSGEVAAIPAEKVIKKARSALR